MKIPHLHTANFASKVWMALLAVVPLIYSSQTYEGALLPKLLIFQILAILLLSICLKHAKKRVFDGISSPLFFPLACYLFFSALSIAWAVNPTESILQLAQYVSLAFVPLMLLYTLSPPHLYPIFQVAAWTGLPIALIGLAQYLGWGFYGIPSNANPSATFFHRNAAAEYLIAVIPLAWVGFRLAKTPGNILAHAGLLALLGTYLVYTRTRGAWVGLSGAVLLALGIAFITRKVAPNIVHARLKKYVLGTAILLILLAATVPDNIIKTGRQRFDEKKSDPLTAVASIVSDQGHRGRLNFWYHTLYMIKDHPLGGVGLGNWQYVYPAYAQSDQVNISASPIRPHNDFLWIAAEFGLPGFLAYITLLLVVGKLCWHLLTLNDQQIRTAVLGLGVLILAHLIDGLFNFPRERITPALYFWFALGCIACLHAHHFPPKVSLFSQSGSTIVFTLGLLLFLSSLAIGYKRFRYDQHHLQVYYGERREDWPTVIAEARKASEYGALRANTFIALGRGLYKTGDLSGAQEAYETALRLHPNSLHVYNNLGIVYRRTGQSKQAIQAFQKALYLYPGFPEAINNLGNVYRDLEQWDQAIKTYQKALGQGIKYSQLYYNLGKAYHMKGNVLRAQENYMLALQQNPNNRSARLALTSLGISPSALPPPIPPSY